MKIHEETLLKLLPILINIFITVYYFNCRRLPLRHCWKQSHLRQYRLGFAILLKFFQLEVKFPKDYNDIPKPIVVHLAKQVGVSWEKYNAQDWQGRSIKYYRSQIRTFLGFRIANSSDAKEVASWLLDQVLGYEQDIEHLEALVTQKFRSVAD